MNAASDSTRIRRVDRAGDRALCDFVDENRVGSRVVVAPGFLQDPEARRWLKGVEPTWTMLEFGSYAVLHEEPSPGNEKTRLEPNLTETDLSAQDRQ